LSTRNRRIYVGAACELLSGVSDAATVAEDFTGSIKESVCVLATVPGPLTATRPKLDA